MVRKRVACRPCLECCFHSCRLLLAPCGRMGNPIAEIGTACFRRFVARPVIFFATTVPWGLLFDWFMLLLGPALICLATSIVCWCAVTPLATARPVAPRLQRSTWTHAARGRPQGHICRAVLHLAAQGYAHVPYVVGTRVDGDVARLQHTVQLLLLLSHQSGHA